MKATKIITKAAILLLGGMMATSCTDLDEELYGRLTPDNYYQNEAQALSSLAGCYEYMAYMSRAGGDSWRIGEYGTDELFCPGRSNGGWYDEYVNQIMEHKCTPDNDRLNVCWNTYIFPGIGADNAVLAAMESSAVKDKLTGPIAEVRPCVPMSTSMRWIISETCLSSLTLVRMPTTCRRLPEGRGV